MSDHKTYQPGEKIVSEGVFGDETFRIVSGVVTICKETGEKKPIVLSELSEGEVFGEMYMFDTAGFRSASAIAKSTVEVEVIQRDELEEKVKQAPQIVQDILRTMRKRLEGTSQDYSLILVKQLHMERLMKKLFIAMMAGILIGQLYLIIRG